MPTLLAIESSPRGEYSLSRTLTEKFIETWKAEHSGGTVVTRDLMKTRLPFVDVPWIAGAYTPAEQHSPEMKEALAVSNGLIAELMAADHIVLGTSMYNFSIPAILKAYIDQIVRVGVTFTPQYKGLIKGKKMTVILASGGVYTPGSPTEGYNTATAYLRQILGFIGITDVTVVLAGGTAGIAYGKTTLPELAAQYEPAVTGAAKA
jgi:FMN-dependent NADH-azoreductase